MSRKPSGIVLYEGQDGDSRSSRIQGQDDIIVDAPVARLWPLIADSMELCNWGPPVRNVKILSADGKECPGTRRRVDAVFNGKPGHFVEQRIEHIEGRKMAVIITEETFELFQLLSEVGSSLEIAPLGPNKTQVTFTFFHNPKGLVGQIMNSVVILRQQRRNRLAALASLKRYAEQSVETQ